MVAYGLWSRIRGLFQGHRWLGIGVCLCVLVLTVGCSSRSPVAVDPGAPATTVLSTESVQTAEPQAGEPEPFRVVVMADSHIIGPNYECCESNNLDTESIFMTEERLLHARNTINQISPPPDFGVLLGDVFHDGYPDDAPLDVDYYRNNDTAPRRAAEILKGFNMPIYPLWGNHDYKVPKIPQAFSDQLFQELFEVEPYYSIDHKGWKFILANSEYGPTWDPDSDLYNKKLASYGRTQLEWMDRELSEGKPSVLLFHYTLLPGVTSRNEDPSGNPTDLPALIRDHSDTLKLALCGHTHRWLNFFNLFGVQHYIIGATRYDQDNFWLIEFYPDGVYRILDYNKAKWATVEGRRWIYSGDPRPALFPG